MSRPVPIRWDHLPGPPLSSLPDSLELPLSVSRACWATWPGVRGSAAGERSGRRGKPSSVRLPHGRAFLFPTTQQQHVEPSLLLPRGRAQPRPWQACIPAREASAAARGTATHGRAQPATRGVAHSQQLAVSRGTSTRGGGLLPGLGTAVVLIGADTASWHAPGGA